MGHRLVTLAEPLAYTKTFCLSRALADFRAYSTAVDISGVLARSGWLGKKFQAFVSR